MGRRTALLEVCNCTIESSLLLLVQLGPSMRSGTDGDAGLCILKARYMAGANVESFLAHRRRCAFARIVRFWKTELSCRFAAALSRCAQVQRVVRRPAEDLQGLLHAMILVRSFVITTTLACGFSTLHMSSSQPMVVGGSSP